MPTAAAVAAGTVTATLSSTVDLTVASFGEPTAAIIFAGGTNVSIPWDGGATGGTGLVLSAGLWAANAQGTAACGDAPSAGTMSTASRSNMGAAFSVNNYNNGGGDLLRCTAAAISGGNGLRFTVDADSTVRDRAVSALLLKGTTNAFVGSVNLGTGTAEVSVTGVGFQPDVVVFISCGNPFSTVSVSHAMLSFGAAHRNSAGAVEQCMLAYGSVDSASNTNMCVYAADDAPVGDVYFDSVVWKAPITSWNSDGFGLTPTANTGSADVVYLALKLADPDDATVRFIGTPSVDGAAQHTEVGFEPDAVCFAMSTVTKVPQTVSTGMSFGVSDAVTNHAVGGFVIDGASWGYSYSYVSNTSCMYLITDSTPTVDTEAEILSFHKDGFDMDYSNGSAASRKVLMLAFGDSTQAGSGEMKHTHTLSAPTYAPGSITETGVTPRVTQTNAQGF